MSSRGTRRRRKRLTAEARHDRLTVSTGSVHLAAQPGDGEGSSQPTVEINAYSGGLVRPDYMYYPTPVVIDLAGITAAEPIAILRDHMMSAIVGQSQEVSITKGAGGGIKVRGIVTGNTDDPNDPAAQVVAHAKRGFTWKASVGIDPTRYERVEAGASVEVNGRTFAGPLYVLRAGVLNEVSLLSVGADKTASAKIAAGVTDMDFHEWLKAKGFDPTKIEDGQRDSLLTMFKAEQKRQEEPNADPSGNGAQKTNAAPSDDAFAHIRERNARNSALKAAAVRFADEHPEQIDEAEKMLAAAMKGNMNPEMFELQLFRLKSEQATDTTLRPSGDFGSDPKTRDSVFEAALCLSGRLKSPERHFDEKVLEAAQRRWRHGLGLGEFLLSAARINGYQGLSHRNVEGLLRAAFAPQPPGFRAAGPSTFDISGILSNVANKFIEDFFSAVDQSWRDIVSIRPVSDFKQISSYSLTGDFSYEKIAPGGEIKHGTIGETTYTNQAETYGRMFAIDRRDIVNDDLGALMTITRRLGRGGALKLNEEVWKLFMNNSTFFTAARGNFLSGATTALSIDSLADAEELFMNQTDPDKKPMMTLPTKLIVPPALKRLAMQLMNSLEVREQDTSATTQYGTRNTFFGAYKVVSSPYLQNSSFTGNSALKWYLLADPADVPVEEACFLNGTERPTVESAQADFNILGIQMRGYFDFGVAMQEYRGGVAMKGEA